MSTMGSPVFSGKPRKPKKPNNGGSGQLATFANYGGFGGLVLFVFLTLFSRFGDLKPLFGKMDAEQTYHLLMTFMILTFALCIFGLLCWVYVQTVKGKNQTGRVTALVILLCALIFGGAMWATRDDTKAHIAESLNDSPFRNSHPAPNVSASPTPVFEATPAPQRTTQRVLAARNFGFSVGGCESKGLPYRADISGELDTTRRDTDSGWRSFEYEYP